MTMACHSRIYARHSFVVLCLLLLAVSSGWSNGADPTTPSLQIVKRLSIGNEGGAPPKLSVDTEKKFLWQNLRLKAIVLRDRDNGIALVAFGKSEVCLVRLRRKNLQSQANGLTIGGKRLVVAGFSDSSIIMGCPDTNRQFIVN